MSLVHVVELDTNQKGGAADETIWHDQWAMREFATTGTHIHQGFPTEPEISQAMATGTFSTGYEPRTFVEFRDQRATALPSTETIWRHQPAWAGPLRPRRPDEDLSFRQKAATTGVMQ